MKVTRNSPPNVSNGSACTDSSAPEFEIVHRLAQSDQCSVGEEIAAVFALVGNGRKIQVALTLPLRLLFDHLAKNHWLAQDVAQIELCLRSDPFYTQHAKNGTCSNRHPRFARSSVRVYISRIRTAIDRAFAEADNLTSSHDVLVSEPTVAGSVGYRLKAKVRWTHLPIPAEPAHE